MTWSSIFLCFLLFFLLYTEETDCLFLSFPEAAASSNVAAASGNAEDWSRQTSVEDQLQVTREKMEQLRRIMEERKAKRRARREARASPYSTSWSLKSSEAIAATASANLTAANLTSETGAR